MKNNFTSSSIKFACALGLLSLAVSSCKKENSAQINTDTPMYQHYKVSFGSDNKTSTYALFTRSKTDFMKEIELTGDQRITVNGQGMNFHELSESNGRHSYTKVLDNVSDVTFAFTRSKGKVFTNSVKKSDVNVIGIPKDLTEIAKGKAFSWTGESLGKNEKIIAEVFQTSPSYRVISAILTTDSKQLIFPESTELPVGSYTLRIARSKTVDTKENNTPAGGEIEFEFFETKSVTVK